MNNRYILFALALFTINMYAMNTPTSASSSWFSAIPQPSHLPTFSNFCRCKVEVPPIGLPSLPQQRNAIFALSVIGFITLCKLLPNNIESKWEVARFAACSIPLCVGLFSFFYACKIHRNM